MVKNKASVLYIHGFESAPTPVKTSFIADLGFTVIAPQLHYEEVLGTYDRLMQLAQEFKVDWLIGSSLGGYTAFWLSQELEIPTLLFNPALPFSKRDPGIIQHNIEIKNLQQHIFLGLKDDTVNPIETKEWLTEKNIIQQMDIIEHPTNGHQIPLNVFSEVVGTVAKKLNF